MIKFNHTSLPVFVCLLAFCVLVSPPSARTAGDTVYHYASLESSVNPVTASYIDRIITESEEANVHALIIQLDTPGGLMDSMNKMTSKILDAEIPIIVWIGPDNARAASAGVFITYASHRAAMAQGTRLGAAHPVSGGGKKMSEAMQDKVVNDAVAQLKGLARKRDRNEEMADSFVRESVSMNAREAIEKNVVNFMANSRSELIKKLAGQTVTLSDGETRLLPSNPTVNELPLTWNEKFLNTLVNPNLVYILMMIGIYGLIYEFSNPGVGLGLAMGGICFLLSLYGLSVLPINYAGLGLLFLGLGLMVLDVFVPSFGILTGGGMVSFFLGSVMLFETDAFSVSIGLIVGLTAATTTFVVIIGYLILGAFFRPEAIGENAVIGKTGTVKETLSPTGRIHVWGEYWDAIAEDNSEINSGSKIEVVDRDENRLTVKEIE